MEENKNQIKPCLWCKQPTTKIDNMGFAFCSQECEERNSIHNDMETYGTDEVICPYCHEVQNDIFEGGYYEADDDEFECDYCEKTFTLSAYTSTSFTAYPTKEEVNKIYKEEGEE